MRTDRLAGAALVTAAVGVLVATVARTFTLRKAPAPRAPTPHEFHAHEGTDVAFGKVTAVGLGLVVFLAVSLVVVSWLYASFTRYPVAVKPPAGGIENPAQLPATATPELQANPVHDLGTFRAREDALLGSYGWVDRHAGVVRIPIARAMDLLAERGLPARANQPPSLPPLGSASRRSVPEAAR